MREGIFDETVVDGKMIDPVFLGTTPQKPFRSIESGNLINSKDYKNKNLWISNMTKKLNYSYDQKSKLKTAKLNRSKHKGCQN